MSSLLFCGPKLAACGIVISIWGVIMLVRPADLWQMESSISWIWFTHSDKTFKLKIVSPLCYFIHPVVHVTSKMRTNKKKTSQ